MRNYRNIIVQTIQLIAAVLFCGMTVLQNSTISNGARSGIDLCLNTIIPSLFPMLVLSSILSALQYPDKIKRILSFPIQRVSGLSQSATPVFLFGALNGYPVGVKTSAALYTAGGIDLYSARKAALINVNPGIVFSVFITGKMYYGSTMHGIMLYLSVTLSNLLLCLVIPGRKEHKTEFSALTRKNFSFSDVFVNAVQASITNIASICAWIVLFSAITAPLSTLPFYKPLSVIMEVTNAVIFCASKHNLPLCAFCMGFGGICIFLQLLPDLKVLGIKPTTYLLCRLFCGFFSFIIELLFLKTLPDAVLTAASSHIVIRPVSVSMTGTATFIFFCIVFMISAVKSPFVKNFSNPLDYKKKLW